MNNSLIVYLVENAEKVKELANVFLGTLATVGLLVLIGWLGYRALEMFKVELAQFKDEIKVSVDNNTQAMHGVKEALILFGGKIDCVQAVVGILPEHHERSKSIKEICCDTNDTLEDIHRAMENVATKADISDLDRLVTNMEREVAVATAHMKGA